MDADIHGSLTAVSEVAVLLPALALPVVRRTPLVLMGSLAWRVNVAGAVNATMAPRGIVSSVLAAQVVPEPVSMAEVPLWICTPMPAAPAESLMEALAVSHQVCPLPPIGPGVVP